MFKEIQKEKKTERNKKGRLYLELEREDFESLTPADILNTTGTFENRVIDQTRLCKWTAEPELRNGEYTNFTKNYEGYEVMERHDDMCYPYSARYALPIAH